MLSLPFSCPPPKNTLSPFQKKPFSPSSSSVTCDRAIGKRNKSNSYLSISLPKLSKVLVSEASNAMPGDEEKEISAGTMDSPEEVELPAGLRRELMPNHVAVIMDGNRRWALERGLPVEQGHRAGGQAMTELTRLCSKWGVKVLTVFAFSTENWIRPKEEVDFLMMLFEEVTKTFSEEGARLNFRLSVIGDKSKLPKSLNQILARAEQALKANSGLHAVIALNYSGRYDILQVCQKVANHVKDGLIQPEDITQSMFEEQLETTGTKYPNPDLLIRTSGEHRISNFMLWQLAYTELYFVEKMFPDFGETDLIEALSSFQQRQRRYGGYKYSTSTN
ncbi:unnamed protein product [Ilex paraguariensis]|uniref:Alkyl transferase n=1 Tax=Ilex paraguariensis TaxID=185542 RepID=A0ABC8T7Y2_9AQUA